MSEGTTFGSLPASPARAVWAGGEAPPGSLKSRQLIGPDRPLWRWPRGWPGERPSGPEHRVGRSPAGWEPRAPSPRRAALRAPPPSFPPQAVVPEPEPRERALLPACPRLELPLLRPRHSGPGGTPGVPSRARAWATRRALPGARSPSLSCLPDPAEHASPSRAPRPWAPHGHPGGDRDGGGGAALVATPRSRGPLICGGESATPAEPSRERSSSRGGREGTRALPMGLWEKRLVSPDPE